MTILKKGWIKNGTLALVAGVSLATALISPAAYAQHEYPGVFHDNIAHFHEHDWVVWRGGQWIHDRHDGRFGWWWVAGGIWYFYPAPVYPWPSPWEPPTEVIVAPSVTQESPPPATQSWYFCDATQKYYPYVATCTGGWRKVPATPAQSESASPPAPAPATSPAVTQR